MNSPGEPRLDPCKCCEADLPVPIVYNRPGLPSLAYRISTHPASLRRMIARLPVQPIPPHDPAGPRPLASLTTRAGDDPAVSLLDAWAVVADVLTFYQERIANEGFLRTATERRSVLEMARTIGYELSPGVAASLFLAFAVENAAGAPGVSTVVQGTKVQSIPGQGQLPQTFETSVQITARGDWNALRPRLLRPQELAIHKRASKLYLLAIDAEFASDDPDVEEISADDFDQLYPLDFSIDLTGLTKVHALEVQQVYLEGVGANIKAGDVLLFVGKRANDVTTDVTTLTRTVRRVVVEEKINRTRIDLVDKPSKPSFKHAFAMPAAMKLAAQPLDKVRVDSIIRGATWRERDLTAFLSMQGWSGKQLLTHVNAAPQRLVEAPEEGVFAFQARLGFFGHNAPLYASLPTPPPNTDDWDANQGRSIWKNPTGDYYPDPDPDVFLERTLQVSINSWAIFESTSRSKPYRVDGSADVSLADYAMSARTTSLTLANVDRSSLNDNPTDKPDDFRVRKTTAYVQSQRLTLAQLSIEQEVPAGTITLPLDRMVLGLQAGQPIALKGERADLPGVTGNEIVILSEIKHSGGLTTLYFEQGLRHSYVRKTLIINANVAAATHGETVLEVLGSGDGAQPHQRFALKKPPLTYVSAPTPSGARSTLQLRVNGVLWEEVQALYGLDGRSESYVVRIEHDGKAHVVFGDSRMGARLPTGVENLTAVYRSGIGLAGMVAADKVTLLQTRPLGIRSVTNPLAATGAADPENRDSARTNAPLKVLTLDRIVSLQDYEDFARAFAGIGKAQAVAIQHGERRLVHITVATAAPVSSPDGEGVPPGLATHVLAPEAPLYENLVDAIKQASDPLQSFVVDSYQPLFFNVRASVKIDPRRDRDSVLEAVDAALKAAFSFEQLAFGQPATAAGVITTIQSVPGVIATDLNQLYVYEDDTQPPSPQEEITPELLTARRVRQLGEKAQLLLINPVGITLEDMTE